MITGIRTIKKTQEYRFHLPLDGRQIYDALIQVEECIGKTNDDRFFVTSDGEDLIFSWCDD